MALPPASINSFALSVFSLGIPVSVNPSANALFISGEVSEALPYRSSINFSAQNGDCNISNIFFIIVQTALSNISTINLPKSFQ